MTIEAKFKQYLVENGIAEKTIQSYVGDVTLFNEYLREQGIGEIEKIKRFYVMSYKKKLMEDGYAIPTINKKMNSIQSYNFFLMKEGYVEDQVIFLGKDQVKVANGSQKQVDVLSEEEINRLLFFIQDRTKVTQRNELIIHLLLYTGVRVSELCSIQLKDIDFMITTLNVFGKGGKYREVPLKQELIQKMKDYIKEERSVSKFVDSEFLFVSQRADRLYRDTVNQVLNRVGKEVKIKLYPHLFRHTFCTRLIQKGVEITTVSKICGHSNTSITSDFYVNISREQKQSGVNLL